MCHFGAGFSVGQLPFLVIIFLDVALYLKDVSDECTEGKLELCSEFNI